MVVDTGVNLGDYPRGYSATVSSDGTNLELRSALSGLVFLGRVAIRRGAAAPPDVGEWLLALRRAGAGRGDQTCVQAAAS